MSAENIELAWVDFKIFVDSRNGKLKTHWIDLGDLYYILYIDGVFKVLCRLKKTSPASADQTEFETNYKPSGNVSIVNKSTTTNAQEVAIHKPDSNSTSLITHDFCNKITWYQKSTQVTDEVLSLDTGFIYESPNAYDYWIDLEHGYLYDEDKFNVSGTYSVVVKIDDVVQTTGYTVNYVTGKVTFDAAPGGVVKASYWYATTSEWSLKPDTGKIILIEHSEIQFAKNATIIVPIQFEIWVHNPYDMPNKIMVRSDVYKNEKDIINSSNVGYSVPAFGNLSNDVLIFPFNYISTIPIQDSIGTELRIRTKDDVELVGEFGTATFYIITDDE